jgi:hypothetical protein
MVEQREAFVSTLETIQLVKYKDLQDNMLLS